MDQDRQQLVKKLQESANVLITVSNNPSVDQLASAIGLTLVLNKLNKHATAVFSGNVPSTIEFLKPEETLEKNTDSLRDFIISLDKAKADKLRYKVEEKLVRIFITPYHTSLSDKDLEFSQGDFNVDIVVALGVHEQKDIDEAITAHGRILHDAAVVSINRDSVGALNGINLLDASASSLAEIVAVVADELKPDALDGQIATAFLTGIVAETERFSNEKTTPATMTLSARLMKAGANQQLVASKLEEGQPQEGPEEIQQEITEEPQENEETDGSLLVEHTEENQEPTEAPAETETQSEEQTEAERLHQVHIDEEGTLMPAIEKPVEAPEPEPAPSEMPEESSEEPAEETEPPKNTTDNELKLVLEPPQLGGTLTANSRPEAYDPSTDPLSLPAVETPLLSHDSPSASTDSQAPFTPFADVGAPAPTETADNDLPALPLSSTNDDMVPPQPTDDPLPVLPTEPVQDTVPATNPTLTDLERTVDSPHLESPTPSALPELPVLPEVPPAEEQEEADKPDVGEARDAVLQAINASGDPGALDPIAALNANPVDLNLGHDEPQLTPVDPSPEPSEPVSQPVFEPTPDVNPNPVEALHIESTGTTGNEFRMPENLVPTDSPLPPDTTGSSVTDPTAPPPVPPPLMPPFPGPQPMQQPADTQPTPPASPFNLP